MTQESREYIGRSLALLQEGLLPFVERRLESNLKGHWQVEATERVLAIRTLVEDGKISWDIQALLKTMFVFWGAAFNDLKPPARSYAGEILVVRNRWAHQQDFTPEDVVRAFDTMHRFLEIISKKDARVQKFVDKIGELQEEIAPAVIEGAESGVSHWIDYSPKVW